jgi:hypothetical protein
VARKPFPVPEAQEAKPATRVLLAQKLESRAGEIDSGGLITNGFVEKRRGRFELAPRPGLDIAFDATFTGGFVSGQGLLMGDPDGTSTSGSYIIGAGTGGTGGTGGTFLRRLPNKLTFTVQPSNVGLDTAISPSIQVALQDWAGNTLTAAKSYVTLTLDSNPGSASLGGTLRVATVDGVATFSDIELDQQGADYTLKASIPGASKISSSFNVDAELVFTQQPIDVDPSIAISPAVTVAMYANGVPLTTWTGNVSISISTNPGGGTLSGTTTVAAVAGVATFSNLSINNAGDGYTLAASTSGADSVTSDSFNIATARLVTITGGSNVDVYTQALAAYADAGTASALYRVKVTGNVVTMTWDSGGQFPVGATFRFVPLATIYGIGGLGGISSNSATAGGNGTAGTNALTLNSKNVSISNGSGNIWGGGGGGGGGGGANSNGAGQVEVCGGGGGSGAGGTTRAGGVTGTGGFKARAVTNSGTPIQDTLGTVSDASGAATLSFISTNGGDGTASGPGAGGALSAGDASTVGGKTISSEGGLGGAGGDFGAVGVAGAVSTGSAVGSGPAFFVANGGTGGAAGKAISLGGGTASFTSGNTAARVKGAVS